MLLQYRRKFIPDEGTSFQDFKFVATSGAGAAALLSNLAAMVLHPPPLPCAARSD